MTPKLAFNDDELFRLTPEDCINAMFEHTGPDGTLYIPAWPIDASDDGTGKICALKMTWDECDREKFAADYEETLSTIGKIASVYDRLGETAEENRQILSDRELAVWEKYICNKATEKHGKRPACPGMENGPGNIVSSDDIAYHAGILCALLAQDPGQTVLINNEATILAELMAADQFAVSVEYI